jgi:hypothetical protein
MDESKENVKMFDSKFDLLEEKLMMVEEKVFINTKDLLVIFQSHFLSRFYQEQI